MFAEIASIRGHFEPPPPFLNVLYNCIGRRSFWSLIKMTAFWRNKANFSKKSRKRPTKNIIVEAFYALYLLIFKMGILNFKTGNLNFNVGILNFKRLAVYSPMGKLTANSPKFFFCQKIKTRPEFIYFSKKVKKNVKIKYG